MNWFGPRSTGGPPLTLDRPPVIALVNNTSDRALRATEGQFLRVLRVTSDEPGPCVRFFTCPEIPRATPPRTALGHPYEDIGGIFDSEIDALIVTGMEPQAANLQEEPVWSSLTKLIDWASVRRLPVIWSCLAAHAAVLHLDGIARIRQGRKLSGIFECDIASAGHPLMAGLPQQWRNPHSRYYDVPEAALVAKGYQVLSRSAKAGVNIFARHLGAPFLFFQGHPEYDPDTLLREYRRDVRRYVLREREEYPFAPEGCLAARTEARLSSLRDEALQGRRDTALLEEVHRLTAETTPPESWQDSAERLYANWISAFVQPRLLSYGLRVAHGGDPDPKLSAAELVIDQ